MLRSWRGCAQTVDGRQRAQGMVADGSEGIIADDPEPLRSERVSVAIQFASARELEAGCGERDLINWRLSQRIDQTFLEAQRRSIRGVLNQLDPLRTRAGHRMSIAGVITGDDIASIGLGAAAAFAPGGQLCPDHVYHLLT